MGLVYRLIFCRNALQKGQKVGDLWTFQVPEDAINRKIPYGDITFSPNKSIKSGSQPRQQETTNFTPRGPTEGDQFQVPFTTEDDSILPSDNPLLTTMELRKQLNQEFYVLPASPRSQLMNGMKFNGSVHLVSPILLSGNTSLMNKVQNSRLEEGISIPHEKEGDSPVGHQQQSTSNDNHNMSTSRMQTFNIYSQKNLLPNESQGMINESRLEEEISKHRPHPQVVQAYFGSTEEKQTNGQEGTHATKQSSSTEIRPLPLSLQSMNGNQISQKISHLSQVKSQSQGLATPAILKVRPVPDLQRPQKDSSQENKIDRGKSATHGKKTNLKMKLEQRFLEENRLDALYKLYNGPANTKIEDGKTLGFNHLQTKRGSGGRLISPSNFTHREIGEVEKGTANTRTLSPYTGSKSTVLNGKIDGDPRNFDSRQKLNVPFESTNSYRYKKKT